MSPVPVYVVDAFTATPFAGNPAAVCPLDAPADEAWMQAVGAEMNLSETAFLVPRGEVWDLRWFTPTTEVDLCGHATLASAHVLWETGLASGNLRFETRGGELRADPDGDRIRLDFPAQPVVEMEAQPGMLDAMGVDPVWVGGNPAKLLVEVADAAAVRAARPDHGVLSRLAADGVILTAPGEDDSDFVSRFFGAPVGIDEDPVTGSAHCALGPYWAERLGRTRLRGHQVSARGGWLDVEVDGDRVGLAGRAVTVLSGQLHV
ncbi:MAG: PhzF family phenazine biosynthesis protein [Actinomycetes bacterium]